MISAGDFRNGVTFEMDNQVYQVIEFQHVKPGKGAAFVRTKYRNVKTGGVVERSFNPSDKFEQAQLERRDMTYLYHDGDLYYFMDVETYDQVPFSAAAIGDALKFLKENMVCKVVSYKGEIFAIEPPIFVELEVISCDPGVKGDTAQNATKNATVETGAVIKVPLFVNQGDIVRIDTRTGEYMERVKA
jgi:elongation factor P